MAYAAGHSGGMTINSVALPTKDAKVTTKNRLGETTSSASGGNATWIGTVSEGDFSGTVIFDDAALVSNLLVGSAYTYSGKLGNSSKTYSGTVVVETLEHAWDNTQGVVLATITGKFTGAITKPS